MADNQCNKFQLKQQEVVQLLKQYTPILCYQSKLYTNLNYQIYCTNDDDTSSVGKVAFIQSIFIG